MQGGDSSAGSILTWHPTLEILAVATNVSVVEYDAVSGCRRNMVDCEGSPVKLQYSARGEYLVLLTKVLWYCACEGCHAARECEMRGLRFVWTCRKEIFLRGRRQRGRNRRFSLQNQNTLTGRLSLVCWPFLPGRRLPCCTPQWERKLCDEFS